MTLSAIDDFKSLTAQEQKRYLTACRQMAKYAVDHSIPITFAPPIRGFDIPLPTGERCNIYLPLTLGKVETATGSILHLKCGYFIVTAEHVLEEYERRLMAGEILNWQVGELPPFDPLPRVVWRGSSKPRPKDIVFLKISEQEAKLACGKRSVITSCFNNWPPSAPQQGRGVFFAGYPTQLREIVNGTIKCGSLSAMFRVTASVGDGTFKCRYEYAALMSFDERPLPMEELHADTGGVSGGPVFGIEKLSYPFVGVIQQRSCTYEESDLFVLESVEDIPSRF